MLNDYETYFNALSSNRINTYKEALKYFNVRYSSFIQNYPKDSSLPACTLAQNGFYFDDITRSIRCIECDFQYNDLNNDLLIKLLKSHVDTKSNCEQAKKSLSLALTPDSDDTTYSCLTKVKEESPVLPTPGKIKKNINKAFASEENRIKSFENIRLLFDVKKLANNGFYRVVKDTVKSSIKKSNVSPNSSGNLSLSSLSSDKILKFETESEPSYIEAIAHSVPALYHIKCAFCSYECLIFRNSLLNTVYKSPFDEHKEKSFNTCQIFLENKMDCSTNSSSPNNSSNNLINSSEIKLKLDWLQALFDFDSISTDTSSSKKINDILVNPNIISVHDLDDLEIKKIPKVIDQLVDIKKSTRINQNQSLTGSSKNAVLYIPKANPSATGAKTTSDFNQLQNVLNKSENVMSDKAYHPAYSQYSTRLDTFKEWPATLSQQPADLAKAGFYYFGIKDMVKCFFCNGGLKNWDHNDDPFQDHVRWFPKCQFIRQLMGHEYVEQVKEKFKNMESGFSNDANGNNQTNQSSSESLISGLPTNSSLVQKYHKNKNKRSVSPRTLNSRLDTYIIRKILDNSIISRDSLKQSIEIKLSIQDSEGNASNHSGLIERNPPNTSNYGDDFKSPVEMALFSYDIDKAKKDKLEIFNSICDFIICNLPVKIKPDNIREFIDMKYGFYPEHVRIIREQGLNENRSFCLVTLKKEDKASVDEIINDMEKQSYMSLIELTKNKSIMIIKTNWSEIEEKIKPLIGKPIDVSTSVEQLQQQDQQLELLQQQIQTDQDKSQDTSAANSDSETSKVLTTNKEGDNKGNKVPVDDKALQLMEENERLKNERLCVICLTKEKNVLFLPCAHLTACLDCSFSLQSCPMCRAAIQATVRTFT